MPVLVGWVSWGFRCFRCLAKGWDNCPENIKMETLTCCWPPHKVHPSSGPVVEFGIPPRSSIDPRLGDVDSRGIVDGDELAVLGLDLDLLLTWRLAIRPRFLSQAHATLHDGQIPRLLELACNLSCHLLLAVLHLRQRILHCLALDLVGQLHQLLGARREEGGFAGQDALGAQDSVLARLLAEGVCAVLYLTDYHLALPPDATTRVGVNGTGEMVFGEGSTGRGHVAGLRHFPRLFARS